MIILLFLNVAIKPPDQSRSPPDTLKQFWECLNTPGHTQPTVVLLDAIIVW